jgi:methenyltetrahydromethanopterin cyclohydrolase
MTGDMNERAWALADGAVERAAELRIASHTLGNGARVLDLGVGVDGGLAAGRLLTELCMGGLGHVEFVPLTIDGESWPGVQVWTDHPAVACMASQYAGWAVTPEGYFAMGSGPLRAIARVEEPLYGKLGYREAASGPGVLVLESRERPGPAVFDWLSMKSGVARDRLTLLVAPTASPAAGVQISARVVETALHKLHELGFDVSKIKTGFGTAPIAPPAKSDPRAIGRTNDCILYGGVVHLVVEASDEELEALVPRVPSSASRDYGTPFYDLFKRYDWDFYKVDPMLFSPAEVSLTSVATGRTFAAGSVNPELLRQSLLS